MYQGNIKLRKEQEVVQYTQHMLDEYAKCREDIIYFAENYFWITTIDHGRMKINFDGWEFQKKILKAYVDPPDKDKQHIIVMLSRQAGKTTTSTIYLLWYALFNRDKTIAILANKEKTALEIMRRIKFAFQEMPLWLQQGIQEGGWNKSSISLENGTRIIAAGTSSDSISGETVSLLYIDEVAKIPRHVADDFFTATYPVIASGKSSKIIMISTPVGLNHFYDFWIKAVRGDNQFYPIKVPWWDVPGRDDEWKKRTISDIGKTKFSQEFSCKFLGSSETLIDSDDLERMDIREPVVDKWNGLLKIYEPPKPGVEYILGIDSAKGTGGDSSVIQVLKIENEHSVKQAAIYRYDRIETHDYAQVCISLSDFYNGAYMMVENNDVGGEVANIIFYEFENDKLLNCDKKGLGIRSTKKSKLKANLLLKRYVENRWLEIYDRDTVGELSRYVEKKLNVFAAENRGDHDDCVTSLLWAVYYLSTDFYEGKSYDTKKVDSKFNIDEDMPVIIFDE